MLEDMQRTYQTFGAEAQGNFYLRHNEIHPRNLMASVIDDRTASITGVLDWDIRYFAPAALVFQPPVWLWTEELWGDAGHRFQESDLFTYQEQEPATKDAREIKAAFDQSVGPEIVRYAYSPDAIIARKVWWAACYSEEGDDSIRELTKIYEDWQDSLSREQNSWGRVFGNFFDKHDVKLATVFVGMAVLISVLASMQKAKN